MSNLVLGNIISFIGSVIMVLIGLIKTKRNILLAQCGQFLFMGIGNLILGGVSGAVSNGVSMVRNVFVMTMPFTTPLKVLFSVIPFVLTLITDGSLLGWLPYIAGAVFVWALDSKNEVFLKKVIISGQIIWAIYDFSYRNYATLAMNLFTITSTLIGIWRIRHDKKEKIAS